MPASITAFFPAYNDAGTIASMVVVTDLTLRQLADDYEIIVVNDGSPDHLGEILADLQPRYPRLRVITHLQNRGYGGALRSGFHNATKELVFYTDGDAQYDPRELTILYRALTSDADMVQGWKIERHDPMHRILIGRIYHWTVKLAFGLRVRDVDCDFRLIRRDVLQRIELTQDSGVICVELMKRIQDAGSRIVEVPVHHYHRAYGKSQFFNVRRVGAVGRALFGLWLRLVVRGEGLRPADAPASPSPAGSDAARD
jgi:glycosyltransferase involved in cell wall biosynthesis